MPVAVPVVEEVEEAAPESLPVTEYSGMSPEEEAFWASFYIAGEDELQLADGIYYMDLYINENYTGYIETVVESGVASINREELYSYVSGNVVDSLVDLIFDTDEDYISLDRLSSLGIGTSFDSSAYAIYLTFDPADMPVQILSIRGTPRRSAFRPIAGGMMLDPAVFVLRSSYSLSARFSDFQHFDPVNSMRFSFSSSNTGRINDLHFSFNYYMYFGADYFDFSLGSYSFYMDFEEPMIRLSFGNVSSDVLYPSGRSIGMRFDRSYAYGPENANRRSQIETMLVVEKRSDVSIYNEGKEIFRRTLDPGRYRLQDFILYSGANEILIRVEPLDGSAPEETVMNVNYSSSLIAPGEFYYGGALVTGRNITYGSNGTAGSLRIPIGNSRYLEYDWRNVTASFYLRTGITDSMSINSTLAMQNKPDRSYAWNPSLSLNTELTHANILGTTRYNLNLNESLDDTRRFGVPSIYARVGHQIMTGWNPLSSLSLSLTYSNPVENNASGHRFSLSTSLSGRLGFLGWSSSLSGSVYTDRLSDFTWSWSNTLSLNLSRYFWLSGSLVFNGTGLNARVSGRVYGTIRFGAGSVSASSSFRDLSVSASYREGSHSLSADIRTNDFTDIRRYSVGAGYSYNGEYINLSASMDSDLKFEMTSASVTLSTSTVFADGIFALGANVPSNFILIRQTDALKGNELSVGTPGSSSATILEPSFGTYIYTGLSSSRGTAFSLFSSSLDSFGQSASFDINVPYSDRNGYVLRLEAERTYSVAGYSILEDGFVWRNGSSPLYSYSVDENGAVVLGSTDFYVFSDSEGVFVVSGLSEGLYAFDIETDDGWMLAVFEVSGDAHPSSVQLQEYGESLNVLLPDVYKGAFMYHMSTVLTSDEFWAMLYPEMEVAV